MKRIAIMSLVGVGFLSPAASSQCETARIQPGPSAGGTVFGSSICAVGDYSFVGAELDDEAAVSGGAVHVFRREADQWVPVGKLMAADASAGQRLGYTLTEASGSVLAGAPNWGGEGAVYVFELQGGSWVQVDKLVPSDSTPTSSFGCSLSSSGEEVLIGAWGSYTVRGAAYLFRKIGGIWTETAKLLPSDNPQGFLEYTGFGQGVALDGDRAVVGCPTCIYTGGSSVYIGSFYVYERQGSTWIESARVLNDDQTRNPWAGSLALSGDTLLVGAYWTPPSDSGAVFAFERQGSGWVEVGALTAWGPHPSEELGLSLVLMPDLAFVGAPSPNLDVSGSVYVFRRTEAGWTPWARLCADGALTGGFTAPLDDRFGHSMAVQGNEIFISGPGSIGPNDEGMARVWSLGSPACSLGASAFAISLASGGVQELGLDASPAHASEPYLLLGTTAGTSPGTPVGGVRLPLNVDGPNGYLAFLLFHPNGPPLTGSAGILDGEGKATASFTVPPGTSAALAGLTMHHSFMTFSTSIGAPTFSSNPLHVLLWK